MTQTDQKGRAMRSPRSRPSKTADNISDGALNAEEIQAFNAEQRAAEKRHNLEGNPRGVALIEGVLDACCRNAALGRGHNAGCPSIHDPTGKYRRAKA